MAIELEQQTHSNLQDEVYQTGRLRRSTLVNFRWMAIVGQLVSTVFVGFILNVPLPIELILSLITTSVVLNLLIIWKSPLDRRIDECEVFMQLLYDVLQLCALLYLTGGMQNPFVLMLVAPVVMAARTMNWRVFLSIVSLVFLLSVLLIHYKLPLPWFDTIPLELPLRYLYGMWTALVLGMLFTAGYTWHANQQTRRMTMALAATDAVLAQQQKLTALGHLSAAAAHELGTPLATIQLVAKDLSLAFANDPVFKDDANLLLSQVHRCRDILSDLATHNEREDVVFASVALDVFLTDIADKFRAIGPEISVETYNLSEPVPQIIRHPELQYCLTNLIENAADFASTKVEIFISWDEHSVSVDILDDGPGFDPYVLSHIGEPYISQRSEQYQTGGGMGLGLFITRTLIERRDGNVRFSNRKNHVGARVTIAWPYDRAKTKTL